LHPERLLIWTHVYEAFVKLNIISKLIKFAACNGLLVGKLEGKSPLGRGIDWKVLLECNTRVYPKVSELAAWSENCKWYSCLPLGAVVSLFFESV
jgi:penicillin V acylase-like amidase (Ntn superfamily)